jgi:hypothetical protein
VGLGSLNANFKRANDVHKLNAKPTSAPGLLYGLRNVKFIKTKLLGQGLTAEHVGFRRNIGDESSSQKLSGLKFKVKAMLYANPANRVKIFRLRIMASFHVDESDFRTAER